MQFRSVQFDSIYVSVSTQKKSAKVPNHVAKKARPVTTKAGGRDGEWTYCQPLQTASRALMSSKTGTFKRQNKTKAGIISPPSFIYYVCGLDGIHTHTHTHMLYICIYIPTALTVYVYIYYVYVYTYIHIYIHTCVCVCMCVYDPIGHCA